MTGAPMFTEVVRHHCRNPRCRLKLKGPVENRRSAFCCRGCYRQFYAKRCLACEKPLERTTPNKLLCGRRSCARDFNGLKAHDILGRYHPSRDHKADERNPITAGTFSRLKTDLGWRVVAGSLTPPELHLATVGAEHVTRTNRGNHREAGVKAYLPINVIGGYRFPGAPAIDLSSDRPAPVSDVPDIP